MQKNAFLQPLALLGVIAIVMFAVYLMMKPGAESTIGEDLPAETTSTQTYDSSAYGLRFSYPDTYVLSERDAGSGERSHHTITLMDKVAAANIPVGGEGPTSITVDIFGNGIDKLPVETWIKNTSVSNYKLSPDETLASTSVAGTNAYSYSWDGLYRGESTVLSHGDNILMFSVTYMDPTDPIRSDFFDLLSSAALR